MKEAIMHKLQQIMNVMKEKTLITLATGKTNFPSTVQLLKDG